MTTATQKHTVIGEPRGRSQGDSTSVTTTMGRTDGPSLPRNGEENRVSVAADATEQTDRSKHEQRYAKELRILGEMFPRYRREDLVTVLTESHFDVQTVANRLTEGYLPQWSEVKVTRPKKDEPFKQPASSKIHPPKDRRADRPGPNGPRPLEQANRPLNTRTSPEERHATLSNAPFKKIDAVGGSKTVGPDGITKARVPRPQQQPHQFSPSQPSKPLQKQRRQQYPTHNAVAAESAVDLPYRPKTAPAANVPPITWSKIVLGDKEDQKKENKEPNIAAKITKEKHAENVSEPKSEDSESTANKKLTDTISHVEKTSERTVDVSIKSDTIQEIRREPLKEDTPHKQVDSPVILPSLLPSSLGQIEFQFGSLGLAATKEEKPTVHVASSAIAAATPALSTACPPAPPAAQQSVLTASAPLSTSGSYAYPYATAFAPNQQTAGATAFTVPHSQSFQQTAYDQNAFSDTFQKAPADGQTLASTTPFLSMFSPAPGFQQFPTTHTAHATSGAGSHFSTPAAAAAAMQQYAAYYPYYHQQFQNFQSNPYAPNYLAAAKGAYPMYSQQQPGVAGVVGNPGAALNSQSTAAAQAQVQAHAPTYPGFQSAQPSAKYGNYGYPTAGYAHQTQQFSTPPSHASAAQPVQPGSAPLSTVQTQGQGATAGETSHAAAAAAFYGTQYGQHQGTTFANPSYATGGMPWVNSAASSKTGMNPYEKAFQPQTTHAGAASSNSAFPGYGVYQQQLLQPQQQQPQVNAYQQASNAAQYAGQVRQYWQN